MVSRLEWRKVGAPHSGVLKDYFSNYGIVSYFKMAKNKKNKEPLGFGFLEFRDDSTAQEVLAIKHYIGGREVRAANQDRRQAI